MTGMIGFSVDACPAHGRSVRRRRCAALRCRRESGAVCHAMERPVSGLAAEWCGSLWRQADGGAATLFCNDTAVLEVAIEAKKRSGNYPLLAILLKSSNKSRAMSWFFFSTILGKRIRSIIHQIMPIPTDNDKRYTNHDFQYPRYGR